MRTSPVLGLLGVCLLTSSCLVNGNAYRLRSQVSGSGVRSEETRTVEDFHSIELAVPADATVRIGEATSLMLSGDDNLLPLVKTHVRNGVLEVEMQENGRFRKDLRVEITTPTLVRFEIHGSGEARIEGVDAEHFAVRISGSGELSAAGRARSLEASIDGSGEMDLDELASGEAEVEIDGSGEMAIHASESIRYSISGSGDIRYVGTPSVSGEISGSGSVRRR